MILTLTPNPCVDKTIFLDAIELGAFMRAKGYACVAGGKGNNVARAVHIMGRASLAMPIVGGHTGRHVVEMLEKEDGLACLPLWVASPTRTITTVLEESLHRQTAFFEPGSRVTLQERAALVETCVAHLARAQVVAFCGTVPDDTLNTLYRELIPRARDAGAIAILDAHGPAFEEGLAAQPTMVKPNLTELEKYLGRSLPDDHARWEAIAALHAQGVELVVLSLGREGALISRGGQRLRAQPPAIHEVNPVGSGDALVAGFAIGLAEGMPLAEMARLGCAMGAANAASWEIGHFTREEVERLLPQVLIENSA